MQSCLPHYHFVLATGYILYYLSITKGICNKFDCSLLLFNFKYPNIQMFVKTYRIAGYLHGVQFSRMSSIYHELDIFTDALFATLHLTNNILGVYDRS